MFSLKASFWMYAGSLLVSVLCAVALGVLAYTGGKGAVGTPIILVLLMSVVVTQIFKSVTKRALDREKVKVANG